MTFYYTTLRTKGSTTSEYHQEYYILRRQECHFWCSFPFSMSFYIFKDFHDLSRPGNQSFKSHDFSKFSMTP